MQLSGVQIQKLAKTSKGRKHVLKFRGGHRAETSVNEVDGLHRAIDWKGAFWIASGVPAHVLNAVAPMPVFTPDAPEVLAWLGCAANAQAIQGLSDGAAAQAAIAALTEANTPFLQSFSVLRFSFLGLGDIDVGATFFIGAALMLITFAIQHRGILGTARVQMWIGLLVVVPMLIVGIVPFFNGNVNGDNYVPLVPRPGNDMWAAGRCSLVRCS